MNNNSLNITDLIKGFRLSCQTEGKSPKTTEWYTCFLARFNEFLQVSQMPTNASQIDKHHVRAFIRYLQTEARVPRTNRLLSPATVQGYVRTLKSFFSWLKREGHVPANPMTGIPIPKAPTKVVDTFTTDQIARLAAVCQTANGSGCRNLSILLLMLDSGIRVSELTSIDLGDVNLAEVFLAATLLFPIYWLVVSNWVYLVVFLLLVGLHVVAFFPTMCPKCSYNDTCPGGQTAIKLLKRCTKPLDSDCKGD